MSAGKGFRIIEHRVHFASAVQGSPSRWGRERDEDPGASDVAGEVGSDAFAGEGVDGEVDEGEDEEVDSVLVTARSRDERVDSC